MLNTVTRTVFHEKVLFLLFAFCASNYAYSQHTFQHGIGMSSFEKGNALKAITDGFIIGGEAEDPIAQERDMLLIRTDSSGNVLWSHTFGGSERETVNDVMQTTDRGFLITAEKYQPHKQEGENLTLAKTDPNGNLQWKKIYDEGGNETEGFSLQQVPGNAYVVVGMVKNMSVISSAFFNMTSEEQNLYMLKVDENGNKLWSRRFDYGGENASSTGTSVILTSDGNYLVTGNVARQGKTDKKIERPAQNVNMTDVRNVLLAKIKPNGTLQWSREYAAAGNNISMGYTIIEKRGGGYLLAGNTNVSPTNIDMFLMSLDADGNVQWAQSFGGPHFESVADVVQAPDGGFVVSGMTQSFGKGPSDVLNFKVDGNGNLQWAKVYGGTSEDYPSKLAATTTGVAVLGCTASFNSQSFDVLFMKTDWNGNSGCLGQNVKLTTSGMKMSNTKIQGSQMKKVEQGVPPPNMQKPDASNIVDNKREVRVNSICQ